MQYKLSRLIAGPLLHGLWRPQVIGAENIPATGGAILASNHLSVLDSVFLPLMLTRPVTFAAKSEYFTSKRPGLRLMGVYLKATGQLSVDRAGARAGPRTAACTGPGPAWAGWPSTPGCRSSRWP